MRHDVARVTAVDEVRPGIFRLGFRASHIASVAQPGQFVNVRVDHESLFPLLRRPFSISRIDGEVCELLFNVVGPGTARLAGKRVGDALDLIGPLGKPFCLDHAFGTAIIVAGGLGVAPFPFLTAALRRMNVRTITLLGARSTGMVVRDHLTDVRVATDDGSDGFRGTVVELLERTLGAEQIAEPRIYGCGPTPMLRALSAAAAVHAIPCELSLEGSMACGVGICQGCPVERTPGGKKYALVCTDGPTFESTEIIL